MRKLTTTVGIYILGWLTIVPYCVWELCTNATRENLALLIMVPIGWIFFYFPIVMPLMGAWKIWQMMKLLEDPERLVAKLRELEDGEGREEVIAFLARENGVPRFFMRWVYTRFEPHLRRALARTRRRNDDGTDREPESEPLVTAGPTDGRE